MKTISLTKGLFALVDDEDHVHLNRFKWTAVFSRADRRFRAVRVDYSLGRNRGKMILMHRLLLNAGEGFQVDHVNQDSLDNRRCNLRLCSPSENHQNMGKSRGCSSRFKGVCWFKGKWMAYAGPRGSVRYLGRFADEEDAALAYDAAAKILYGKFARLNFN